MMNPIRVLACGLCCVVAWSAAHAAPVDTTGCSAEQAVLQLGESYRRQGPLTFDFLQQTVSSVFGDERSQRGRAWLDPSGRFRVEAEGETFVFRDDTLWHYVPAHNQVTVRAVDSTSRAGLPTDLLYSLQRDFLPVDCRRDTVDGRVFLCVRTVARTESAAIQRLTVWIEPRTFLAERAEYVDYNDDRVTLRFDKVRKDRGSGRFVLVVPDSVEVVTLPTKKRQQNATTPR